MVLPFPLLQLVQHVLPLSLFAGTALAANSAFNVKSHGTGWRYATTASSGDSGDVISTGDDLTYTVDITLGGQNFTVILDTGSTDLWVNTTGRGLKLTNSTDLEVTIGYGQGGVDGNIAFAELMIGDFVVPSQAFLNPTDITDMTLTSYDGIMGMAFDVASIYSTVQRAWGTEAADDLARSPITSLFAMNPSLPNNFDVELARTSELEDDADGAFVISGHADGFAAITQAPQLPRVSDQHWSIVLDAMKVNGQAFSFAKSRISGTPAGKIVAALDTGFSFPPLPAGAVDAIYGTIPGALFDDAAQLWMVPCDAATNLTFTFGGQEFPVHPLDLTYPFVVEIDGKNATVCINTYQYLTLDPNSFVGFDVILGDAFLRNVYASFDYGDYYPNNRTNGIPFVQLLSTTNTSSMWSEFHDERAAALAELPPTVDPSVVVAYDAKMAAAASSTSTSSSSSSSTQNASVLGAASSSDDESVGSDSWGKKYGPIALGLLGANLLVGLALLGVTLTMCVRGMKGRASGRYAPVRVKEMGGDDYEHGAMSKYSD